jgi:hypothetical protein
LTARFATAPPLFAIRSEFFLAALFADFLPALPAYFAAFFTYF